MRGMHRSKKSSIDIKISELSESEHKGALRRIGWLAASTLTLTTLATFAVVGFIGFLWFAGVKNTIWHAIMIENWATRSVTISTLLLRFATDLQAGVAAAMLAALILETSCVPLHSAGQISIMRATKPQPRALLELIPAISAADWRVEGLGTAASTIVVLVLFATTTALQFSSTALLSDVQLGVIPSLGASRNVSYDFAYSSNVTFTKFGPGVGQAKSTTDSSIAFPLQARISTWLRNPPSYPAFAEYSKSLPSVEGVDDTGVLLRAFLPFSDAQSRETIHNYSGKAMVMDSRVSCQRPKLTDVSIKPTLSGGRMLGKFEPSQRDVARLWTPQRPLPFNCSIVSSAVAATICQITAMSPLTDSFVNNGGLMAEFWNITNPTEAIGQGLNMWSLTYLVFQSHNVIADAIKGDVKEVLHSGSRADVVASGQTWSVSICYSSWMSADLNVQMSSNGNRSEPIGYWNHEQGFHTKPDILSQMGNIEDLGSSPESRGILRLDGNPTWIPDWRSVIPNQVQPIIQQFADVTNTHLSLSSSCSECSALLAPSNRGESFAGVTTVNQHYYNTFVYPEQVDPTAIFLVDNSLSSIFHQAWKESKSLASAMSTLITLLSSMAYYDQMPQFDQQDETSQTFFVTVLFPQSHLGLWALGVVLATHVGLVWCIAIAFAMRSRCTLLGNYWQTISQLLGPETRSIFTESRMASDREIKAVMKANGRNLPRVSVRCREDGRMVGLIATGRSLDAGESSI